MTRPVGPSLVTLVRRTLTAECGVQRGDSILVAVSGGGDSCALLHALARLAPELGLRLEACGVDHGLRAAAADELALAAALANALRVPFCTRAVRLDAGGNVMARARDARYAALREVQCERGMAFLATAHHADDRAETVLLRLLRGSGPQGLAVLPARAESLLRPMIRVRKPLVLDYLKSQGVDFAEDPSNRDARYLRSRVRHELVPLLTDLSPGIVEHLVSLADELSLPVLPPVYDETGEPVRLRRSHRQQLRRALTQRNVSARVLLPGNRVISLCPRTGLPRLEPTPAHEKEGPRGESLTNPLSPGAQKPQK